MYRRAACPGGPLKKEEAELVELTKLNGETIMINALQIEYVELIPESKIIMMNGKFHIVSEDKDEVKRKVLEFLRSFQKGKEGEA